MPGVSMAGQHQAGPREGPEWLNYLLQGSYFTPCNMHVAAHKNERNFFCTDCSGSPLCSLCVQKCHSNHSTMQIRRSSYHEAVRISDVQRLVDISGIQVYVINSAKIVFLNGRPQARPQKGAPYSCETCHRTLLDNCCFCSIGCKLGALSADTALNLQPRLALPSSAASGASAHPPANVNVCMGEEEESADSGERYARKRDGGTNWRKRSAAAMPPLIVDDGADSSDECSQQSENGERGRAEEHMFGQLYGQFKKKRRTAVRVVEDVYVSPLTAEPSSPTSALRNRTPSQYQMLDLFQWKGHRRKGVPQRAPLW